MEKMSFRRWDPLSAGLLIFAILLSTWRLTITDWTPHVGYVSNMALAGIVVGLLLGHSRFEKLSVRLLSLGYTLVAVIWQLTGFYGSEIGLTDRLLGVGGRILYSINQYTHNKPVNDELFVVFLLSLGYWIIGLTAGYALTRSRNYLVAVLPAAVAMMIVHHYDPTHPTRIWFIAVYFMLALGLLGRQQFLRRKTEWSKNQVQVAPESAQELSTAALIAAGALVVLAWTVPAHPSAALGDFWDRLSKPWENTKERMRNAFASVKSDAPQKEFARDTLFLGNTATLDKSLVFTVTIPPEALDFPRLYWRGRAYDHYENGQWTSSEKIITSFSPDKDEFNPPERQNRQTYEFSFTTYIHDQATLYVPGQPLWISHAANVRLFELSSDRQDILNLIANPLIQAGDTYTTRSIMSNPSVAELREAVDTYPIWVEDRYLQLPDRFPVTIKNYAEQITAGLTNPYDKAEAITSALRANIEYKPSISPPTDGRDVIEWFLFDAKQGYCNYYATAEVLMLRSIGIPARMAVGFARGDSSPDQLVYTVRNANAHAWPEVYFPGYGWVEFEPTVNQDPLVRPEEQTTNPSLSQGTAVPHGPNAIPDIAEEDSQNGPTSPASRFSRVSKYYPVIAWTLVSSIFIAGVVMLNRRMPLARSAAGFLITATEKRGFRLPEWLKNTALYILLDPIERSFHVINLSLKWLGKSPALHYTPSDRAAALIKALPEATEDIEALQREYQAALYSPRAGNGTIARLASRRILGKTLRAVVLRPWA